MGALSVVPAAAAQGAALGRYRVIVERQPFGEGPASVSQDGGTQPPGPALSSVYRLCAISYGGGKIYAGIIDMTAKPKQVSYYIEVGEEEGPLRLLSVDVAGEQAVIEVSGVQQTLRMTGDPQILAFGGPDIFAGEGTDQGGEPLLSITDRRIRDTNPELFKKIMAHRASPEHEEVIRIFSRKNRPSQEPLEP